MRMSGGEGTCQWQLGRTCRLGMPPGHADSTYCIFLVARRVGHHAAPLVCGFLSLDGCHSNAGTIASFVVLPTGMLCRVIRSALSLDGRNFHAWNYRQFIVKLLGVDSESELAYSSTLIAADFSNYSAWHYRTMLLPRLYNEDITTGDDS